MHFQPRSNWALIFLMALLGLQVACTDEGAPWQQPAYGTRYCYDCAEIQGALGAAEYGPASWVASPNFKVANRGTGDITVVVMHTVQGSYSSCVNWFQNPAAQVSAHYVVSKTGAVTQMVKEKDIAWHVGNQNGYTIGIEHEGFVDDPAWATAPMVDASAQLTCYLLKKYGLSASNDSIKGHVQLPNQTHTDPGKYWKYVDYLAKVQACMGGATPPAGCPGGCDDSQACTDDACDNGVCKHTPNTGAICWDGDACTAGEKCNNGACVGGKIVKDCSDGNPCTDDGCTAGNCTYANNTVACNDNNPCTGGDACKNGTCVGGVAASCDDKNPCTTDACSGSGCKHDLKLGPCDDGDGCTIGDLCVGGLCQAGAPKTCMDGNPCTTDACEGGKCQFTPLEAACDDGDACTQGDYCAMGQCLGGTPLDCDDELPCTADSCVAGVCQHDGATTAATPTCQGPDVQRPDPCGGPAKIEPCPAGKPCSAGVCGGAGDAGPADGAGLSGDAGDAISLPVANAAPQPASGCDAGRTGLASQWWVLVGVLAAALRGRRRVERR